jgi:ParB family chromosome partitioning protein
MASAFKSEQLRGNMAESLARRPSIAIGSTAAPSAGQFQGRAKLTGACVIEVDRIVADPDQPRKTFSDESIDQLAASLKSRGQLVPILVRWTPEVDRYTIVDGERRFRAAERAGLANLAAVDVTDKSAGDVLEIQLVTNALREDVPAVEQARSWQRLMEAKGLSQRELAELLGYDHTTITRALGLLNLPEPIQAAVDAGQIRPQTGYELSRIEDPEEQATLAEEAKAGRLKRDDLRKTVKASKSRSGQSEKGRGPKAKPLPTERSFKAPGGSKVVVTNRKGVSTVAWVEALRAALEDGEARLAAEGESSEAA